MDLALDLDMRHFVLWILLGCVALSSQAPGKRAVTIDCTIAEKQCDLSLCDNPSVAAVSCPHTCGYCEATDDVDCSQPDKEGICQDDFCSLLVNDVNVTQRLCPHFCNFCTNYVAPTYAPCEDNLVHGVHCTSLQDICEDPLASTLCARTCGLCEHEPTLAADTDCIDHITNNLTCSQIPSFCVDPYAVRLCRLSCGKCQEPHPTDPVPTTTTTTPPPPTTTTTTPQTTTAPPIEADCQDYVGNGFHCSFVAGICDDSIGRIVCRKYCGACRAPDDVTEPPISYDPDNCTDHMTGVVTCDLLHICDSKAKFFCPQYCKLCGSQPASCVDHLNNGNTCEDSPYICDSAFGKVVCPRSCGTCAGPPPSDETMTTVSSDTCQDHVGQGLTCQQLTGVCVDPSRVGGDILCPRFCKTCQSATCVDHVINGKTCESMASFICDNVYGNIVCPRACGTCAGPAPADEEQTTVSSDPCQDHVGKGLDCSQLTGICHDESHIGNDILCPRYCSICQPSGVTTPPVSTLSPDSSTVTGVTGPSGSGEVCQDNLLYGASCADIDDVCISPLSHILCRRHCGYCTGPTEATPTPEAPPTKYCTDLIGHGLECNQLAGSVCGDVNFRHLCPSFCGACDCHDNVGKGESCDDPKYADICEKPYGHLACPSHCGQCPDQAPTSTSDTLPHSTPTPSPSPSFLPCEDHVGGGVSCPELRDAVNFCQDPNSKLICRQTCGHCSDDATTQTSPATTPETTTPTMTTTATTSATTSTLPPVTAVTDSSLMTTTVTDDPTTIPDPLDCVDHLINGVLCSNISDVCQSMYGRLTCKRFCGTCTGPTPPPQATVIPSGCEDNVGLGLKCQELPGVCQDQTRIGPDTLCPKFCIVCATQAPTTQSTNPDFTTILTTLTSSPALSTTDMTSPPLMTSPHVDVSTTTAVCEDMLKGDACEDMEKNLPNMCTDPASMMACARYCGYCTADTSTQPPTQTTTTTTTTTTLATTTPNCKPRSNPLCVDKGDSELCNLHLFCSNEVAKSICQKTCHFCDAGCEDRLVSTLRTCPGLMLTNSDLCQDDLGSRICQKTCGCQDYCPLPTDG